MVCLGESSVLGGGGWRRRGVWSGSRARDSSWLQWELLNSDEQCVYSKTVTVVVGVDV